jgi:hypothetical protein
MLLSSTHLFFGNFTTASTGAGNFLPNVTYSGYFDTDNEVQRSQTATYFITSLLTSRYGYCVTGINSTAAKLNYQATLSNLQNYNNIVFFSKGHRTVINDTLGIIPYHDTTVSPLPSNAYLLGPEIYNITSTKNVVTFIWHCQTAIKYPGSGLPYSFTHNNGMGYYGGTGSQVYLGWTDKDDFYITWPNGTVTPSPSSNSTGIQVGSPQYEWKMTPTNDFGRIAELYWYYMYSGYSSIAALDQATQAIYVVDFSDSYINGWLVVWGNKNLTLP